MTIYEQIKALFCCLACGLAGGAFGLLLGFYDYNGGVYYDINGGVNMFLLLFVAVFVACLWDKIKGGNDDK